LWVKKVSGAENFNFPTTLQILHKIQTHSCNQPRNAIIKIMIIAETEVIWQKVESLSLFALVSWQHITACFTIIINFAQNTNRQLQTSDRVLKIKILPNFLKMGNLAPNFAFWIEFSDNPKCKRNTCLPLPPRTICRSRGVPARPAHALCTPALLMV